MWDNCVFIVHTVVIPGDKSTVRRGGNAAPNVLSKQKKIPTVTDGHLLLSLYELRPYPWSRDRPSLDWVTFYGFASRTKQRRTGQELVVILSVRYHCSSEDNPWTWGRGPGDLFAITFSFSQTPAQEVKWRKPCPKPIERFLLRGEEAGRAGLLLNGLTGPGASWELLEAYTRGQGSHSLAT